MSICFASVEAIGTELREYLHERVGEINSPASIVILGEIPRNARDKIERNTLREKYAYLAVTDKSKL